MDLSAGVMICLPSTIALLMGKEKSNYLKILQPNLVAQQHMILNHFPISGITAFSQNCASKSHLTTGHLLSNNHTLGPYSEQLQGDPGASQRGQ